MFYLKNLCDYQTTINLLSEIIHTRPPPTDSKGRLKTKENREALAKCYEKSLTALKDESVRVPGVYSVAIPILVIGEEAANIAIKTVAKWLSHRENAKSVSHINLKFLNVFLILRQILI